jgi:hypothetical protein
MLQDKVFEPINEFLVRPVGERVEVAATVALSIVFEQLRGASA